MQRLAVEITRRRVLVVEDVASVARALERALRLRGHEVVCAESEDEAWRVLVDGPMPDVIILDADLGPGGSGTHLAIAFRAELARCPPLVLHSGSVPELGRADLQVFDAVVTKGASSASEVVTLVGELCSGVRVAVDRDVMFVVWTGGSARVALAEAQHAVQRAESVEPLSVVAVLVPGDRLSNEAARYAIACFGSYLRTRTGRGVLVVPNAELLGDHGRRSLVPGSTGASGRRVPLVSSLNVALALVARREEDVPSWLRRASLG